MGLVHEARDTGAGSPREAVGSVHSINKRDRSRVGTGRSTGVHGADLRRGNGHWGRIGHKEEGAWWRRTARARKSR